jgi:signal transduction histidine kinase
MPWLPSTVALTVSSCLLWAAGLTAWRNREAPAANLFGVVAGATGAGALTVALGAALELPHEVVLASAVITALLLPIPWVLFCFAYTGRAELVSPGVAGVIGAIPAVGLLATSLIFGSALLPWLRLPSREATSGAVAVFVTFLGITQWLAVLYAGGLMLVGSGAILRIFYRYRHLDSVAGTLLVGFGTIPWLALLFGFQVSGVGPLALPRTVAVGFLTGGVAAAGIIGWYHLFTSVPAAGNVGPSTVIEELDDVVVVTDGEGTIVEVNDAAERLLDASAAELVGAGVDESLGIPFRTLLDTDTVSLNPVSGRKILDPAVSELTDQHGHRLGYAVVLRDVTARITRQQRLEVLNRILRHNLGNDMNVVLGQAEWIQNNTDDPRLADSAKLIADSAKDLAALSDEAREIEQLMATTESSAEELRLAPLVETVLTAASDDYEGGRYECGVPEDLFLQGSDDLLGAALTNLVENAIEHNDCSDPWVEVTASYEADETYPLRVSVADDGPGLPPSERQVITEGHETPLRHGSGLGLWVVSWSVTRMGGDIEFEPREPAGTIVTLRFPRARRASGDSPGRTESESVSRAGE